ncbi:MAG: helix-turn-helix domain-containing protein [Dokdonella sp.]|nr:helix-turn-helix domain-containing protein [Dokdonella sp.]
MKAKNALGPALRTVRNARGLSQEAFSDVSSRTYMSSLERGLKSPTLSKLEDLCELMDVHPVTLFLMAYAGGDVSPRKIQQLLARVQRELDALAVPEPQAR